MILSHWDQVLKVNRWINHFGRIHTSASQSKKAVCAFQTAFFYLERFLKILADDQCSLITKDNIYHINRMSIQHFTIQGRLLT